MTRHKLIQILATLSRREMTRFREFACSPCHNKHKEVRALVEYLSESYPGFSELTCNRHLLFHHVFPGKIHDQGKLAVVFTYTYRLWEEFAAWETLQKEPEEKAIRTLKDLRERSGPHFEKKLDQISQQLEEESHRDGRHHLLRYRLATEADRYFAEQGHYKKDFSLQAKQAHLDHFFISEKLKDACEAAIRKRILKVEYQINLLDLVFQEVESNWSHYEQIPSVATYYQIYRLLQGASESYFQVVDFLERHEQAFRTEEQQLLYHYLQNYCIEQINRGKSGFLRHSFELYQRQLAHELLFVNGFLPEGHYKNLVTIGLRLQENEWVEQFIHAYRDRLPPQLAENAFTFNLASYYYATGQLDRVQQLLNQVEYTDLRYNLGAKALLLRTYYDLEEDEALLSLADAFQQYLKRNELLADDRVQAFRSLLRFTRRTMTLRAQLDYKAPGKVRKELEHLQMQIEEADPVINKEWLLEKVEKLKS